MAPLLAMANTIRRGTRNIFTLINLLMSKRRCGNVRCCLNLFRCLYGYIIVMMSQQATLPHDPREQLNITLGCDDVCGLEENGM